VDFSRVDIEADPSRKRSSSCEHGKRTVPTLEVGGRYFAAVPLMLSSLPRTQLPLHLNSAQHRGPNSATCIFIEQQKYPHPPHTQ